MIVSGTSAGDHRRDPSFTEEVAVLVVVGPEHENDATQRNPILDRLTPWESIPPGRSGWGQRSHPIPQIIRNKIDRRSVHPAENAAGAPSATPNSF